MEGFEMAMDLLEKLRSGARHCREVYQLQNDDAVAIREVEDMLREARDVVSEDQDQMDGLVRKLRQEIEADEEVMDRLSSNRVDEELEDLNNQLKLIRAQEQDMEERIRVMEEEVNGIECDHKSVEAKKEELRKMDELQKRTCHELSLYAHISKLLPGPDVQSSKYSFAIMDNQGRIEELKWEKADRSDFEMCEALWHLAGA